MKPSMYVDGVDFQVFEQSIFSEGDYSHKFKHAGLRYEVATALGCSKIVHIAGGVPCGDWPDKNLAMACLIPKILPGEKVSGDKGYLDGDTYFFTAFVGTGLTPTMHQINRDLQLMEA